MFKSPETMLQNSVTTHDCTPNGVGEETERSLGLTSSRFTDRPCFNRSLWRVMEQDMWCLLQASYVQACACLLPHPQYVTFLSMLWCLGARNTGDWYLKVPDFVWRWYLGCDYECVLEVHSHGYRKGTSSSLGELSLMASWVSLETWEVAYFPAWTKIIDRYMG